MRSFLLHDWTRLVLPLCVFAGTLAIGFGAKRLLFRMLGAWAAKSKSHAAATFTRALRGPFMIWVLILAVHLATESSDLPPRVTLWSGRALLVLWIVSLTVMVAQVAGNLIRFYGNGAAGALPVTTLTQNLAQLGVFILGLLVLLNQLGIPITPILTFLGVGGLAVALALQDTLANLFAGFYIAVAGQVRIGDYIRLNTSEEGYVSDITWRSTMVRSLTNNFIIIPNTKLSQAIVTNFHLPEKRLAISVQVGVDYGSDPDRVEAILLDIARSANIPGLLAEPAPSVSFDPGFGDSALLFTLNCQVAEFVDQYRVRHELRKAILKRFRGEGIGMPFPTRTVYVHGQPAGE